MAEVVKGGKKKTASKASWGGWGSGLTEEVLLQAVAAAKGGSKGALEKIVTALSDDGATGNYRMKLNEAIQRKNGAPIEKGSIVYSTEESLEPGAKEYLSTLSSVHFSSSYSGSGASKKLSQEDAAKNAMQAEFPDEFEWVGHQSTKKSPKVKGEKNSPGPLDAKSKLCQGIMLLHGPLKKDDITFTVEELGDKSVATVTVNCMGGRSFKGAPQEGTTAAAKKKAQGSAATKALAAFQKQIDAKAQVAGAAKEEKKRAALAMFAEKKAAKKAAKAAS